ncbi:MAG: sulfite exporter TauE/SafE family protein [Betaproteobacteria bacterium]|nr:sulfite exporter TauE/SafE family protein [Betaproteobacteria bacterium]
MSAADAGRYAQPEQATPVPLATYLAMLTMGLAGGLHCAAMCGGFASAAAQADWQPVRRFDARWTVPAIVWQHAGRLATYATLGALVGAMTAAGRWAPGWLPLQVVMFVAANLLLVGFGLGLAGREVGTRRIEAFGFVVYTRAQALLARIPFRGSARPFVLGLLWGLVPCGLIYAALAAAALAADPVQGALLLLAFGLGTLPNLLAAHWVIRQARRFAWPRLARFAMAALLVGFGIAGLARTAGIDNPGRLLALCWPGAG